MEERESAPSKTKGKEKEIETEDLGKVIKHELQILSLEALGFYGVFLNHHGPDVKDSFVSFLYDSLCAHGCNPFLDVKSLIKGMHSLKSINEALHGVRVHLAIFSRGYAKSSFCLNELCDMMKCPEKVIPVFFEDVEPRHLRCIEQGPFTYALERHSKRCKEKDVERWKIALRDASYLRGFQHSKYKDECALKKDIVARVLEAFVQPPLPKTTMTIQMEERESAPSEKKGKEKEIEIEDVNRVMEHEPQDLSLEALGLYDVFLNHGPDVRGSFVSHLYDSLCAHDCNPFLDGKNLIKGTHALKSINEALHGVRVHLAIFSRGYVESDYCLDELCDMMECPKKVIPVFFQDVEPRHLRWIEQGPLASGFYDDLGGKDTRRYEKYKIALQKVSFITGFRHSEYKDECALNKDIVARVLKALGPN